VSYKEVTDQELIRSFADKLDKDLRVFDERVICAFEEAVFYRRSELVEYFLTKKVPISDIAKKYSIIRYDDEAMLKRLIDAGVNPNQPVTIPRPPVYQWYLNGHRVDNPPKGVTRFEYKKKKITVRWSKSELWEGEPNFPPPEEKTLIEISRESGNVRCSDLIEKCLKSPIR
jgi:hypothetical protein